MSSSPENTPDLSASETDEPGVIRKPITFPIAPDDETKDGPRSTKNDREIKLETEEAGEPGTAGDTTPKETPGVVRKPITFPIAPDDEAKDGPRSTKNDREIKLETEDTGEPGTADDTTPEVPEHE